jgi:hypothetical protein
MATAGPGRPKGDGGKRAKIPEDKWETIYELYSSGVAVTAIHRTITDEWKIDVGQKAVYSIINTLRLEKRIHLNEIMNADTDSVIDRYKWLLSQLEITAIETRANDKDLFLKVADRLIHMYEYQLNFQRLMPSNQETNDNGKAEILAELANNLTRDEDEKV